MISVIPTEIKKPHKYYIPDISICGAGELDEVVEGQATQLSVRRQFYIRAECYTRVADPQHSDPIIWSRRSGIGKKKTLCP